MNTHNISVHVTKQLLRAWLVASAVALLAACGAGGGDVDIGSGQGADPVVLDFPIAYVKRSLPVNPVDPEDMFDPDLREQRNFDGPADLWLRDRSGATAPEKNITGALTGGTWDIRDVDVSFDGNKLVFAMRKPLIEGADESEQPTWNIYEYDRVADTLRRVIASDTTAEEGHDVAPHYLPDNRIVFASTRQRQSRAILIDEGKPQFAAGVDRNRNSPAFTLHVMNADGSGIRQISFNQSHDLDPSVLSDGRIIFTRWDNAVADKGMHLYAINPDGTNLQLVYGRHSHDTGTNGSEIQFVQPRERPDGRILSVIRPYDGTEGGGDLALIDVAHYVDNTTAAPFNAGGSGPAQSKATVNNVSTLPGPSKGGRYASAFPLWDGTNRILVSWSQCRVDDAGRIKPCTDKLLNRPGVVAAPPLYGIWMYTPSENTQVPVVQPVEGTMFTDIVAMQPRASLPPVILDKVPGLDFNPDLAAEGVGIINIKSVYDYDGVDTAPGGIAAVRNPVTTPVDNRPARFLRIEKAVSLPDEETLEDLPGTAFGAAGALGMREILGYAMIEPDGSVQVKVPANVAFEITILDKNGRRVPTTPRHFSWLQVRAGETVTCNGCHTPDAVPPAVARAHGRAGLTTAVNTGAAAAGPFPSSEATLAAQIGETMAETRMRVSCETSNCVALKPSVNVVFDDVWTDPLVQAKAPSFAYQYSELNTPAPVASDCGAHWTAQCRITIHYPMVLQPLWDFARVVLDGGGAVVADNTCTRCHGPVDGAGAAQVPAGQLNLTSAPSSDEPDHFTSFRKLVFGHNEQILQGGVLVDRLVDGPVDPVTGLPAQLPVTVSAPMVAGSAAASTLFFSCFEAATCQRGAGSVDHRGFLSPGELKLISEWLDIGAQYYNDPFAVPVN